MFQNVETISVDRLNIVHKFDRLEIAKVRFFLQGYKEELYFIATYADKCLKVHWSLTGALR